MDLNLETGQPINYVILTISSNKKRQA